MLKVFVAVGAGVIAGFTCGYFMSKKKYEDLANAQVEEMRDYYLERVKDSNLSGGDVTVNVTPQSFGYTAEEIERARTQSDLLAFKNREKPDIVQYSSISRQEKDAAEAEHPEEDDMPEDEGEKADLTPDELEERRVLEWQKKRKLKEPPKIISSDEYEEKNLYDKETLFYYNYDGVLTTDDDEVVDNVYELIGDALTKYGFSTSDERTIYVRNNKISTDFEIQKVESAYSDMQF